MSHRILFFSSSEFALPLAQALMDDPRVDDFWLVSAVDAVGMRHFAETHSVRHSVSDRLSHEPELMAELKAFGADILITFSFGQILNAEALALGRLPAVNVHPSILPEYRGPSPMTATLLHGDKESAITLIQMAARMDAGPILFQRRFPVPAHIHMPELHSLVGSLAAQWVPDWILSEPWPEAQIQDESHVSFTRKIERIDGLVNFKESIFQVERKWRAYDPWPGLFCFWGEKRLKLIDIEISDRVGLQAGELKNLDGELFLGLSDGSLRVQTLQLEGKKVMPAGDFLRGLRGFDSVVLRGADE